jgi:hypothetical protein
MLAGERDVKTLTALKTKTPGGVKHPNPNLTAKQKTKIK